MVSRGWTLAAALASLTMAFAALGSDSSRTTLGDFDAAYSKACGAIAGAAVCRLFDIPATVEEMWRLTSSDPQHGTTMANLERSLRDKGLFTLAMRVSPADLSRLRNCVFILPIMRDGDHYDHYVVVAGKNDEEIIYYDYPHQPQTIFIYNLLPRWRGHVLAVWPSLREQEAFARSQAASLGSRNWLACAVATTVLALTLLMLGSTAVQQLAIRIGRRGWHRIWRGHKKGGHAG